MQDSTGRGLLRVGKPEGARDRAFGEQALASAYDHGKLPDAQLIDEIASATLPMSRRESFQVTKISATVLEATAAVFVGPAWCLHDTIQRHESPHAQLSHVPALLLSPAQINASVSQPAVVTDPLDGRR